MAGRTRSLLTLDLRPLRRRELRLLLVGRGVSFFGAMVAYVAIPFQVYDVTGSTIAVGLLGVVELVTLLGLAFLGGAMADAHDRRRLILVTEFATLVTAALLAVNAVLPDPNLVVIFVLAAAATGCTVLQRPAYEAMFPRLVPDDEMTAAAAIRMIQATASMIIGPAIGGLLIASVGVALTYVVDAATSVVGLVALAAMHAVPPPADAERPSVRRVVEGLRYALDRRDLLGTYLVDMVAMFFGMPMALFPAMADDLGGPEVLGLLYAAPAIGAFVATATSGWTGRIHRHGLAISIAASIWGAGIIGFGLAGSLPLALAGLIVAGGADTVSGLFRMTIWNQTIPDSLRGRLASIEMVSYSAGPLLGNTEAGLAAAAVGVRTSVVLGGFACIAGVVIVAVTLPAFRRYDSRPRGPSGPPPRADSESIRS